LASVESYRTIMSRVKENAGELQPEVRWFVDPFRYFETLRIANREKAKKRGRDMLRILANQGFDAIQGMGGFINFSVNNRYEMVHQTLIYAPAVKEAADGQRYRLAAQAMEFPNVTPQGLEPQAWVPRE